MRRAIVVGAGVGGLAAALELRIQGFEVQVFERASHPGGKLRQAHVAGQKIDAGPTVLTMRWVFEELFAAAGADLAEWVELERAEVLARHVWPDGSRLDLFTDLERNAEAIEAFAGRKEADGYRRFSSYARRIYELVEAPFLRSERPGFASMVAATGLGAARAIDPLRTMWKALGGFFTDPRLQQLFGRYATYVGSSPFRAPATLNLISHVEQTGVDRVRGGMFALGTALCALAESRGAIVHLGAPVAELEIERGAVRAVRLASGERHEADVVVLNADVAALASGAFGAGAARAVDASVLDEARSLSAITWAASASVSGFPLLRHNVFFSSDYRVENSVLFERRALPEEPTVYVCAQDRGDHPLDGAAPERLLILVNAPAGARALKLEEIERCEDTTFSQLERCGLKLHGMTAERSTPADFAERFPATQGAIYGAAAHGWTAALKRPAARTRLSNLYLAGGSVHPGPGVPMAALSGRIAARRAAADHGSTSRSRKTVTVGGTSMR